MSPELVENEEQYENKKMKSIVVEEQEQEEGSESETGFVDLDWDTLLNVLERVDVEMSPELVENEKQYENKKMKSIVVEEQEQEQEEGSESETGFVDLDWDTLFNVLERVDVEMSPELVENEEQYENKKMKSIVVEEQEQEEGSESETGFVDLDWDTLLNVLERVDVVTLGRAACVNKLWREVALDERLWEPIVTRNFKNDIVRCKLRCKLRHRIRRRGYRWFYYHLKQNPLIEFLSIDFSEKITPWV